MRCYIGLGSNLDDPIGQLTTAIAQINAIEYVRVLQCSALYSSKPVGPQDQPDFVNAVLAIETSLLPLELLDQLQAIEQAHHRKREVHWGPRTLDLDLLTYGDQTIDHARLTIPHPYMLERGFVLQPLADIAPNEVIQGKSIKVWQESVDCSDLAVLVPANEVSL